MINFFKIKKEKKINKIFNEQIDILIKLSEKDKKEIEDLVYKYKFITDKDGNKILLYFEGDNDYFSIAAYNYRSFKYLMKLTGIVEKKENKVKIADILPPDYDKKERKNFNKGIGSEILKFMDELMPYYYKDIHIIYGDLSDVDLGHRDRQIHFYKKNGFEIDLFHNDWGKIEKSIYKKD